MDETSMTAQDAEAKLIGPVAASIQGQLDGQRVEIEKLKDEFTIRENIADAAAEVLQTRVDAQEVEIVQLGDDLAAQKESTDATTEILQTQIDAQQAEIVNLGDTIASQTNVIDTALSDSGLNDETQQELYTDYLKSAADDLRGQFHREQAAHSRTQQRLLDAIDVKKGAA